MAVYLYTPPMWQNPVVVMGHKACSVMTSTVVYRMDGVWHNVMTAGPDNPVVTDVDVDADTGLRLFFTKSMVVPDTVYDGLSALQPADPSWTPGTLTLL